MKTKPRLLSSVLPTLSVALLLVSLGAAFGVLSGRGPLLGLISTAIIVLVTSLVGGTRYGVSSLTGPMTAAIAVIIATEHGSTDMIGLTLLIAAGILFVLRSLNIHKLVTWIPNLVIAGFMNGIAVLILMTQGSAIQSLNDWILLAVSFLAAMGIHQFKEKFTHPISELLASSFLVILVLSLLSVSFGWDVQTIDLGAMGLKESLSFHVPHVRSVDLWLVIPLAFELSLIALLDTLLTGIIMEKESAHQTNFKRELTGQSLSMFITGWIAGIPGAQSTVPSMMLFKEGAHHRYAKFLLAVFTIAISLLLLPLIEYVPVAVFAGVIFKIALDVADFTSIRNSKPLQLFMLIGTMLSTVLISLNLAVIGFTLVFIAWNHWAPQKLQIHDLKEGSEFEGFADEL